MAKESMWLDEGQRVSVVLTKREVEAMESIVNTYIEDEARYAREDMAESLDDTCDSTEIDLENKEDLCYVYFDLRAIQRLLSRIK